MVRTSPDFGVSAFTLLPSAEDAHHIAQFDESPELFVRRRGQVFQAAITLEDRRSDARYGVALALKDTASNERVMKIGAHASGESSQVDASYCAPSSTPSEDANTLLVDIYLSPTSTPVGLFTLAAVVRQEGPDGSKKGEVECEKPVFVIFNPWCEADECFLDSDDERNEYVLQEEGYVYQGGSGGKVAPKAWSYDQFDAHVVKAMLLLLNKVPMANRSSAVLVSRAFSALINSSDDDGVLTGNWSGDYSGGVAPYTWNGSQPIFQQYVETNGREVKYGQCWVFAGVLTTAMRTLGIACRPVTNYNSAHDTNANRTIEYYYEGTTKLDKSSDSVWNFHVWCDVWLKRADLGSDGVYDGWQAIDATPQEESDGLYQMGPAPLVAVQKGKRVNYDTDFVLAEVNADMMYYQKMDNGKFQLSKVDTKNVGKRVITKAVGSEDAVDVVSNYKAAEGSASERATMLRATEDEDMGIQLELALVEEPARLGSDVTLKLIGTKSSDEELSIVGDVLFYSRAYHGRTRAILKTIPLANLTAPFEEELVLSAEEYAPCLHAEAGFWIHMEVNTMVTEKKMILTEELDFELDSAPCLSVSFGEADALALAKGEEVSIAVTITNPFASMALTGGSVGLEGAHRLLCGKKVIVDVPDLEPGASTTVAVPFTPCCSGSFNMTIDVDFNEACDITTFTKVTIQ